MSVTVCIPHKETVDLLRSTIPLWRLQSQSPFIVVVDTGSKNFPIDSLRDWRVNNHRAIDLIIQQPGRPEWVHFGDPVAAAHELAQGLCFTDKILFTHTDVYPKRRDLIESLSKICTDKNPVVGYRMSPRDHSHGFLRKNWRQMVGHSLLMVSTRFLSDNKISWSRSIAESEFGVERTSHPDNWDSEVTLNLFFRRAGVEPLFLGDETNFARFEDENIVHCRSTTLARIGYLGQGHRSMVSLWNEEEAMKAQENSRQWSNDFDITIFVPLSGRKKIWPRFSAMIDRIDWPKKNLNLVFLDTSQDDSFSEMVSDWIGRSPGYRTVRHSKLSVGPKGLSDMDRSGCSSVVQNAMSKIYRWARNHIHTDLVLVIEDDVIPESRGVLKKLVSLMGEQIDSVSAAYPQKVLCGLFAWSWNGNGFSFESQESGSSKIGGNGFGCVLLRSQSLWCSELTGRQFSDVDLQFYADFRDAGKIAVIDWDSRCEHISETV